MQNNKFNTLSDSFLRFKSLIFIILLAGYILNVMQPCRTLNQAVNYLTILAVFISIPYVGRSARIVCLGLFAAGAYLLYISGADQGYWVWSIGRNTSLLMLLISVPLLGVPLKFGGYLETLDSLAGKYMLSRYQMYCVPALFSHLMGVFMNIGAVPLAHQITVRGNMEHDSGLLAKSISRGFGSALFWSPNMIATALVLGYLKVSWGDYVQLGIVFGIIALAAGFIASLPDRARIEGKSVDGGAQANRYISRKKLVHLALAGIIFLSTVIYIETGTKMPVISVIPIIAIIFPLLWLFGLGQIESIREGYGDYFKNKINRYDGEIVLFVVAGFFSSALAKSGWASKICGYLMHFSGNSMASVAITILITVVLTSVAGIHPMVSVSAFATSLNASALGLNPVHLALTLIGAWSLGATVSPMSGTTLVVGSLTGKTSVEVGLGNIMYAVLVSFAIVAFMACC